MKDKLGSNEESPGVCQQGVRESDWLCGMDWENQRPQIGEQLGQSCGRLAEIVRAFKVFTVQLGRSWIQDMFEGRIS